MIIVEILLLIYFAYVSFYAFFFAIAGLFFRKIEATPAVVYKQFAVLIPAYKEDRVILGVAEEALKQNYPQTSFDVVIIADSLREDTLDQLRLLPVKLVIAHLEGSTKVKALNLAFQALPEAYDYALILDADNVMERDFLSKVNAIMNRGCRALQAERTSKNATTSMSILDGFSERINNYIYRQGHVAAGLSCSLIGSGMVFEFSLVKNILSQLNSIGGFDRELELALIRKGIQIHYGKGVLVFDEKVESTEVFEKQRTRWLSSQFIYLNKYFSEGMQALLKGNISMFNSAILKNIQLPRVINLGLLLIVTLLSFILRKYLHVSHNTWFLLLLLNIGAILLAIPIRYYNRETFRSVFLLPKVFMKMFNVLFKLRGANRSFIHTPHSVTDASNKKT